MLGLRAFFVRRRLARLLHPQRLERSLRAIARDEVADDGVDENLRRAFAEGRLRVVLDHAPEVRKLPERRLAVRRRQRIASGLVLERDIDLGQIRYDIASLHYLAFQKPLRINEPQ